MQIKCWTKSVVNLIESPFIFVPNGIDKSSLTFFFKFVDIFLSISERNEGVAVVKFTDTQKKL
jgi:hypothetical protein